MAVSAFTINFASHPASAISYTTTGSAYTQNFDTLANSGTSSTLPSGWGLSETGTKANGTYTAGTGSSSTGDTYSFGSSGSTDRALGTIREAQLVSTIGVSFTNNTTAALTRFAISYVGEEWRLATANHTDQLDFQYSLNATSLTTGTWTDINNLDFVTPNATTAGVHDGNTTGNRTQKNFLLTGISLPIGSTIWLRWVDFSASGGDDGLAVDNFSFTASASTAVDLMQFKPLAVSGGVWLRWKTGMEINNVGFNVYKQTKADGVWGPKVKLNPSLIASAMLTPDPRVDADGGYLYGWPDTSPGELLKVRYWLQDVETTSIETLHGPTYPQPGPGSLATRTASPLLSEIHW